MRSVLEADSFIGTIQKMLRAKPKSGTTKNIKGSDISGVSYLGSISRYSKGMIMSFPLLCDASLPLDTVMMVSKANERNIVNMLQILFSSMNLASNTGNGRDVIAAIYKDLDPNMAYNDFIDLLDKYTDEKYSEYAQAAKVESALLKEAFEEWKQQKAFKKESLNEHSVNEYCVKTIYDRTIVTEAPYEDPYRDENQGYKRNQEQRDQNKERREQERAQREKDKYTNDVESMKRDIDDKYNKLVQNRFAMQDVKKANDLEPTLMIINYNVVEWGEKDETGQPTINKVLDRKSFVAGVKSRAVPVESLDIVERFVAKDRTKINFRNFIRATTGEISLVKDFILCLDKLKLNARNDAKRGPLAQYWNILEKRSIKNNVNKLKREGTNDGSAITTIVISQDAVNYMKSAYKFDLENIANARMIMESYNLLGLMIADEATESVKILYDGYNEFEIASYRALDREASDKEYKKLVNLINSQGR